MINLDFRESEGDCWPGTERSGYRAGRTAPLPPGAVLLGVSEHFLLRCGMDEPVAAHSSALWLASRGRRSLIATLQSLAEHL
jgi:hypothetical protein